MINKIFITLITMSLLSGLAQPVSASGKSDDVNFGSCLTPQWGLSQVNTETAKNHGVLGYKGGYSGTDKIYKSDNNALQCLCTGDKGYETKWLDASTLSQAQINVHKKDGWKLVATGLNWGLADVPYLGKTTEYACKPKIAGFAKTGMFEQNLVNLVAFFGALSVVLGSLSYIKAKKNS